jgi:hypothetical protein
VEPVTEVIKDHVWTSLAVVFSGSNLYAALFKQFSCSLSNNVMNNMGGGSWRKTHNYSSHSAI